VCACLRSKTVNCTQDADKELWCIEEDEDSPPQSRKEREREQARERKKNQREPMKLMQIAHGASSAPAGSQADETESEEGSPEDDVAAHHRVDHHSQGMQPPRTSPNAAVQLYPRRKAGKTGSPIQKGRSPMLLSYQGVASLFGRPQPEAAERLGISLTSLKEVCRKLGVPRWPYRRGVLVGDPVSTASGVKVDGCSDSDDEAHEAGCRSSSDSPIPPPPPDDDVCAPVAGLPAQAPAAAASGAGSQTSAMPASTAADAPPVSDAARPCESPAFASEQHFLQHSGGAMSHAVDEDDAWRWRAAARVSWCSVCLQPKASACTCRSQKVTGNEMLHMHIQMHMRTWHKCTHAHMHTCTHAHMHTHTHNHLHAYIHTYIHTYTRAHRLRHTPIAKLQAAKPAQCRGQYALVTYTDRTYADSTRL